MLVRNLILIYMQTGISSHQISQLNCYAIYQFETSKVCWISYFKLIREVLF